MWAGRARHAAGQARGFRRGCSGDLLSEDEARIAADALHRWHPLSQAVLVPITTVICIGALVFAPVAFSSGDEMDASWRPIVGAALDMLALAAAAVSLAVFKPEHRKRAAIRRKMRFDTHSGWASRARR